MFRLTTSFALFLLALPNLLWASDAGVSALLSPSGTCGFSSSEPIKVAITNFGSDPLTSVDLVYYIDGISSPIETYSGGLAVGATAEFTFSALADLSAGTTWTIAARTLLAADTDTGNDSLSVSIASVAAAALPLVDQFEFYVPTATVFTSGLVNLATDDLDYRVGTGPTPSGATGPSAAAGGVGNYIFIESSSPAVAGDFAVLSSGCLDLSAGTAPRAVYAYHMYGNGIGFLQVTAHQGTQIDTLALFVGQQQASNAEAWRYDTLLLNAYSGGRVELRWQAQIGTTGSAFNSDIALDQILIENPVAADVAANALLAPLAECGSSSAELVTLRIANPGLTDQSGFDVGYRFAGPTGVFSAIENIGAAVVPSAGVFDFTFSAPVDLSLPGIYVVEIWTDLPSDVAPGNDTLSLSLNVPGVFLPDYENFDSYPDATNVFVQWANDPIGDEPFQVNYGATPSTATGPTSDVNGSGGYLYMEASNMAYTEEAVLRSGCISLATGTDPVFIYGYHMYGAAIGSLAVLVDTGAALIPLGGFTGPQQVSNSDPWRFDTLSLAPFLGQSFELVIIGQIGTSGTAFNADIALDELAILNPIPDDLGISAVLAPVSSCGDNASATVTVRVTNFGTSDQTGFDIGYRMDGPGGTATVAENIGSVVLVAGSSLEYSFASPVDLLLDGDYTLRAWTSLPADGQLLNDTLSVLVTNLPSASDLTIGPFEEEFDAYPDGSTVFTAWQADPSAALGFEVNFGPTSSTGTGPGGDAGSGSGGYIYMESSGSIAGDQARICSGCLDLSGTFSPEFDFAYHMYGAAVGSLQVTVRNADSLSEVFSLNGPQQFSETDPWGLGAVSLSPWIDQVVEVCVSGTVGTTGSSFTSDIALDNLVVKDIQPNDLSVESLLAPVLTACDYGSMTLMEISISNEGFVPQSGFDVGYRIVGPGGIVNVLENVGSLVVPADSIRTYMFSTPADLSADGLYSVQLYTALSTDVLPGNDTLALTLENVVAIASFPLVQDFESFAVCGTTCASDCSAAVANGWIQDQSDDADWLIDFGGTSTAGTGPSQDQIPGTAAGLYLFTESSGACMGVTSNLISPCIDISALSLPAVRFFYHMYGATMGSLSLDISEDDGGSWTELWSRSGQDQSSSIAPWTLVTQTLLGYSGTIRLRLRGVTGPGITSDMAIDGIEVLDIPPFDDLNAVAVLSPIGGCEVSSAEGVAVVLKSLGTNPLSGFDVGYSITGPLASSVTENVGAFTLLPGQTDTFFFSTPADLSAEGTYAVRAFALLPTDAFTANDSASRTVVHFPVISLPQTDDFNSYPVGTSLLDFLTNDPLEAMVFEINVGPTSSTGTGPNDDVTGGGGYLYMESSFGAFLEQARVCTPCLDLTGGSTGPNLNYAYHMAGLAIGSLTVDVLQGADTIPAEVWTGPQQVSEAAPWKTSTVDLSAYDDQLVRVCFTGRIGPSGTGSAFQSDIALDEIRFRDPAQDDLAVLSILSPENACDLGSGETVSVEVGNIGVLTQSGFSVNYQVNSGPVVTEVFADSLALDETVVYTFAAPADLSAEGDYLIRAWTNLPGDDNLENDTAAAERTHILSIGSFPYVEDFESGAAGWTNQGLNNSWQIGEPSGTVISSAVSGTNAMVTNLSGFYNNSERSVALSPCMDFSALDNPGVRLSLNYRTQAGIVIAQDGVVLQTSIDQGIMWRNVGDFGDPDGWYNFNDIAANPGDQEPGLTTANGWAGNSGGWTTARHALDGLSGEPSVILRLAFASDAAGSAFEGIGVDDVIVADMPFVNLGPDLSTCAGYVLDAGNPGNSYLWSNGATTQSIEVSSTGFYSVTVTDAFGFTGTDGINVTVIPSPSVELGADQEVCDSIVLDAGNPLASHFWNTGENTQAIVATASGTYTVLVTNTSGCFAQDSISVIVNRSPEAGFTFVQSGAYIEFVDASPGADSWSWSYGDGATSTDQNPNHIYPGSGNYLVTLVASNSCGSDTTQQTLAIFATGLEDPSLVSNWQIYPNPSDGLMQMRVQGMAADQSGTLGIFNAAGQLMLVRNVQADDTLDLRGMPSGSYTLRLVVEEKMASRSIVLE